LQKFQKQIQHFKPSTPGNSDTRSKKVDLAIVEIIATDIYPFTVVSAIGIAGVQILPQNIKVLSH